MATGKPIYWDSCVFLSWLNNEPRKAGEMEGIEQTVKLIQENKINLVTSVFTELEVLDIREWDKKESSIQKFHDLFERPNIIPIIFDYPVAKLASSILRHYKKQKINVTVVDSIHLASAIHMGVEEFHTFDGSGKKPKRSGLLRLNGNVAGYKLQICKPYQRQLNLLNQHDEREEEKEDNGSEEEF